MNRTGQKENGSNTRDILRAMVSNLIEETQRLEEKYGNVISFLVASGIDVGDPQFDALNGIKDGDDDVERSLDNLLAKDTDEDDNEEDEE